MIKELVTIVKVKIWFATVNQFKLCQAKYRLWKYEKTLSPKNLEYARNLRRGLALSKMPGDSVKILVQHAKKLSEEQFRLIEQIDRAHKR